ncbi:metallophosphoesterase family protein [Rhizobium sp. Root483D2]|uniref:metallophosphoesterase family protein n=1 Tax=Rhizobium sp. Root483D2 TaxID=1736545 RepID=UPI0007144A02|nr:metallophosphoesterase family protein [Rhizobium sp. Root483D2]KQY20250.1 serine/threonine protein phosphatase [Rhizobium sp. Root483D2]
MSYTFAIGDIHGCLDKLKALVSKIEAARPGGTIVFLGDYVDRGPESKGVIDFIMAGPSKATWTWVALKGNHEDMMVGALTGEDDPGMWLMNGGKQTMDSYGGKPDPSHVKWIKGLPTKYRDENRVYAHADMDDSVPFDEQREAVLLWSRKPEHYSGTYWGKHFVHGHTPSHRNPNTIGNRTNLDSGAVFGGKLSCAIFHDESAGGPLDFIQA